MEGQSALVLFLLDPDSFQERLNRARSAEEFFNGNVHVTRIARFVDLLAQSHARFLVEITVRRFFEHRRHVRRDRVRPRVPVITGAVTDNVVEIRHKRRVLRNRQERIR